MRSKKSGWLLRQLASRLKVRGRVFEGNFRHLSTGDLVRGNR